jgi:phage gp36-like protein
MSDKKGYITYVEFKDRFNDELTNILSADTPDFDDEHVINKLIQDSSNEMDMDLNLIYDTDELRDMGHPVLKRICADLTYFYALKRKGIATHQDNEIYYKSAKTDLFELGKYQKKLPGVTPSTHRYKGFEASIITDKEEFTTINMEIWKGVIK